MQTAGSLSLSCAGSVAERTASVRWRRMGSWAKAHASCSVPRLWTGVVSRVELKVGRTFIAAIPHRPTSSRGFSQ